MEKENTLCGGKEKGGKHFFLTQEKNNREGKGEQNLEKGNIFFLWRRRKTEKENIFVFGDEKWRRKRKKIFAE